MRIATRPNFLSSFQLKSRTAVSAAVAAWRRRLRKASSAKMPIESRRDEAVAYELTESRLQALAAAQKQAQLDAINEVSPLGLLCFDAAGYCNYANRAFERISGMTLAQAAGKGWRRCVHPDDRYALWKELPNYAARGKKAYSGVFRLRRKDGRIVWASVKVTATSLEGRISGYVASVEDITAHRAGELALLKSEQRLRLITDNIPALVAYVTPDERVAFANRRYEEAYGILHEEVCGMRTWEVLGAEVYAVTKPYIQEVLSGKPVHFERRVMRGNTVRFERVNYVPDFDADGRVIGYFGMVDDITALKQVEAELRKLVRYDSLTGLGNRAHFEEKLNDAIRHSRRNATLMAVMFLDVDHFKSINDTLGHQGGDEVLREFAKRLQHCVRETDTVARLAGDEFVIILEGLSNVDEAAAVANKIVGAMSEEFEVAGAWRRVTTSIGVTVRTGDEENAMALLKRADKALYRAKSAGRNTFAVLY
jgi:diguanylate cyclase (GGDEF)-like protein/PAS domain S-box-containing protein